MQAPATTETMDPGLLRLPRLHSTARAHSSRVDEDVAAYSPAKEVVRPLDIDDLKKAPTGQALATTISSSYKPPRPLDSAIGLGSSVASNNGLQKLDDLSGGEPRHHGGSILVADDGDPLADQEEDTLSSLLPYRRAGDRPSSSKRSRICRRHRQRRQKRNSSDDDEDDGNRNGKGNGANGRGGLAGPGTVARHLHPGEYSCPFRKRSPATFNVRKHPKCATKSWKTLSDLKKHVTEDHQRVKTFPCLRCRENCGSPEGMQAHWQSPQMCDPKPLVATAPQRWEDGISERTCEILRSRKDEEKVTNWEQLWVVLFGQDAPVEGCDFVPVVELEELLVEFNTEVPRLAGELHERLCSLLGDGMRDQSRHRAGEITDCVKQWINSFHASCRDIASREQNAAGAQTRPGQCTTTEHAAHLGVYADQQHGHDPATTYGESHDFAAPELDFAYPTQGTFLDHDWGAAGFDYHLIGDNTPTTAEHNNHNASSTLMAVAQQQQRGGSGGTWGQGNDQYGFLHYQAASSSLPQQQHQQMQRQDYIVPAQHHSGNGPHLALHMAVHPEPAISAAAHFTDDPAARPAVDLLVSQAQVRSPLWQHRNFGSPGLSSFSGFEDPMMSWSGERSTGNPGQDSGLSDLASWNRGQWW